jgi:hypothetical protein
VKCGEEIRVRDAFGAPVLRFIAQCQGRWIVISSLLDGRNGYLLPDDDAVIRELVCLTVPAALTDKVRVAEASPGGRYAAIPLSYPLSVRGIADLFGIEDAGRVRAQLKDYVPEVT